MIEILNPKLEIPNKPKHSKPNYESKSETGLFKIFYF
jgi:hypothetical protein